MPASVQPRRPGAATPNREVVVDAALVAAGLGLETRRFRELMDSGRIASLCERGTGEDAGRYRLTFYHGERRVRLVTDSSGNVLHTS